MHTFCTSGLHNKKYGEWRIATANWDFKFDRVWKNFIEITCIIKMNQWIVLESIQMQSKRNSYQLKIELILNCGAGGYLHPKNWNEFKLMIIITANYCVAFLKYRYKLSSDNSLELWFHFPNRTFWIHWMVYQCTRQNFSN